MGAWLACGGKPWAPSAASHRPGCRLMPCVQGFAYFRQQEPQLEEDEDLLKSISVRFREQVGPWVLGLGREVGWACYGRPRPVCARTCTAGKKVAKLRPTHIAVRSRAASSAPNLLASSSPLERLYLLCVQVGSAGAPEVALLLSAMARLRRYDPALLADACRLLAAAAPSAPLCALAEATWALALLQHVDEPLLKAVVDRVTEAARVASGLAPAPQSVAGSVSSSLPLPLRAGTAAAAAATMAAVAKNTQSSESVKLAAALQKQASSLAKDQRRAGGGGEGAASSTGGSVSAAYASRKARSRQALAAAQSAPARYSAMWPTQVGPGGHLSPCTLTERFNPSLPFHWSAEAQGAGAGGAHGAAAAQAQLQQAAVDGGAVKGASAAAGEKGNADDAAALADPDAVSKVRYNTWILSHVFSQVSGEPS